VQTAVLSEVAQQRTGCACTLLLPDEAAALATALENDDPTLRACACMAVATAFGDSEQAHFWTHVPAMLATHAAAVSDAAGASGAPPFRINALRRRAAALSKGGGRVLYSSDAIVDEAQRRMDWHEAAHGGSFGTGEFEATEVDGEVARVYNARILEYVCVGDYEMAVSLAMASPPARSMAFYRNSLLTIAAASATRFQRDRAGGDDGKRPGVGMNTIRSTEPSSADHFAIQALKVVAEHARSIGDIVTGVLLLVSAGRFQEAVGQLQAGSDWHRAVTLAAHTLSAPARNALLHAWALLLQRSTAGGVHTWHVAGLLVAAGSFRSAVATLRTEGAVVQALVLAEAAHRLGAVEHVAVHNGAACALPQGHDVGPSGQGNGQPVPTIESVFVEPGSAPREASRLLATNLDCCNQLNPLSPSESECVEVGTAEISPDVSAFGDSCPELPGDVQSVGAALAQKDDSSASAGVGGGGSPQDERFEVLTNLYAPVAVVQAGGGAEAGGTGTQSAAGGQQETDGANLSPTEMITRSDDLASMRSALRRHAIDVLSEALASESWV
jgi:hypothetical protein